MRNYPEYNLQKQVCQYLDYQYPEVKYSSDTISHVKLKPSQAKRNKDIQDDDFHLMDLMIFKTNSRYSGLFLELKVVSPFKKNGELKKSEHLENQQKSIGYMNKQGYLALFAWEFEIIKEIIDNYMKIV